MSVLMPRHFPAIARRFAECLTTPQDDIGSDDLFHKVENVFVAGDVEESLVPGNSFIPGILDVYADELLRASLWV